jgi:hypothetical protein
MKHIDEYNDKEFIKMVQELNDLPTYLAKVKYVYEKFGRVRGSDSRKVKKKTYVFSITPATSEENRIRWEYFFEVKSEEIFNQRFTSIVKSISKVKDKKTAIEGHILDLLKQLNESPQFKFGYEIGSMGRSLDIDSSAFFENLTGDILNIAKGYAIHRLVVELNSMKDENETPEKDDFPVMGILNEREKITLLYKLGFYNTINEKFGLNNQPKTITLLTALLLGIDQKTEKYTNLYSAISKMNIGDTMRGPLNKTNSKKIEILLSSIGLDKKKLMR